ncbi:hypothetical protein [Brevibacillus laterosporus]|uniref:hypothetical protein n=1 Tax=Brevibacillus laterosporus TaxID=1465 RepID=UPI003D1FBCC9
MPPIWKRNPVNENPLGYRMHEVPTERIDQIQEYLISNTLRVYCGTSYRQNEGIYGVASSFVGFNSVLVHDDKIYSKLVAHSIFGELCALKLALLKLPEHVTNIQQPDEVILFSDYDKIQYILENSVRKYKVIIDPIITEINSLLNQLKASLNVDIEIRYLGADKRHNPFYKSAHNASRKAIGIS